MNAWLRRLFRRRGHRRSHRVTTITRTVLRETVPTDQEDAAVVEEEKVVDEPGSLEAELVSSAIPEIAVATLAGVTLGAALVWATRRWGL